MNRKSLYEFIKIDYLSATPKYIQLANSIIKAIYEGKLKKDELLPSLNDVGDELELARATVEKSYKYLRDTGIIASVPGKGYFVRNTQVQNSKKILLLFNKLSPHKKIVYDSFVNTIGEAASIDFFIYNNDFSFFKKLLLPRINDFTHFVIIPLFSEGDVNVHEIINKIPKQKLILLDKLVSGVTGDYAAIYENFELDIYSSLVEAKEQLIKYQKLKLLFPENTHFPIEIVKGFENFCMNYVFKYEIVHDLQNDTINKGEAYITLMEADLVYLVEKLLSTPLNIGSDIGIISYNESPLKKIILNGITTISTDFQLMGDLAAQAVLTNSKKHEKIPFYLTLRSSL